MKLVMINITLKIRNNDKIWYLRRGDEGLSGFVYDWTIDMLKTPLNYIMITNIDASLDEQLGLNIKHGKSKKSI